MATTTITNLPTVTSLTGNEPLLGVQNGNSVQITTGQIAQLSSGTSGYLLSSVTQLANNPIIGTPSSSTYLRGDGTWAAVPALATSIAVGITTVTSSTSGYILYNNAGTLGDLATTGSGSVTLNGSPTFTGTVTSPFYLATGDVTGSLSSGAYSYGSLSYSDSNIYLSAISSQNSYTQAVLQNTNSGASASVNYLVSNNLGTASTYYGEFGMNSSAFSGTGAFNAANTVYLDATSADLAIGTTTANAIHFVVNGGATDAATISSAGVFSLGTALAVSSGGTGAGTFTANGVIYGNTTSALGVTAAGTTGQVLIGNTGAAPSWGAIPSTAAVTSISFGTTGLTPSTATTGAVTVAGTLVAANGGTGQSLYAVGDLLYASTTTALSKLADVATGSVLVSGGVGVAPAYSASPTLTTSLTTPLVIGGTTASSTLTLESTSGAGTTDSIIFKTGSQATRMTIDTSGNVGVNTTTMNGKFNIQGASVTNPTTLWSYGYIANAAADTRAGTIRNAFDANSSYSTYWTSFRGGGGASYKSILGVAVGSGDVDVMTLDSSGNVGIGTTSPGQKLDVNGLANFTGRLLIYSQNSTNLTGVSTNATLLGTVAKNVAPSGGAGTFQFTSDDAAASQLQGSIQLITDPTAANRRLAIGIIEQGSGYKNITLAENGGNVGIGTTSPSAKFMVTAPDSASATNQMIVSGGRSLGSGVYGSAGTILFTNSYWTGGYGAASITGMDSGGSGGYLGFATTSNGGGTTGTPSERMRIDSSGNVSIGGSGTSTGVNLLTNAQITGATSSYAHYNSGVIQSGVTVRASAYVSNIQTAAAAFTTTDVPHFWANPSSGGAGSTITSQYGFLADTTVGTQGAATVTNAYGFFGNLAAASNRWNLFMNGTANNYMAGALGVGTTTVGVAGSINAIGAITFNTTTNNQSYTTTSTGTITISSGTLGTIDNITIGGTTRAAGNFTFVGAGKASSTVAFVSTAAGTTAVAPLQFTSGTNLTTAAAGAVEYDGSVQYFSPAASTRSTVAAEQVVVLNTAYTLTSATGVQKLFNNTTNGAVTLPVGTYQFECYATLSTLAATGTFGFALAGAATYTQYWQAVGARVAAGTAATASSSFNTTANAAITPTSATTTAYMWIRGILNVTVAGTVIPQFSQTVASAAVVGVGSFFKVSPFSGSNSTTNITVGNWS
jgi:hypothetical protein